MLLVAGVASKDTVGRLVNVVVHDIRAAHRCQSRILEGIRVKYTLNRDNCDCIVIYESRILEFLYGSFSVVRRALELGNKNSDVEVPRPVLLADGLDVIVGRVVMTETKYDSVFELPAGRPAERPHDTT